MTTATFDTKLQETGRTLMSERGYVTAPVRSCLRVKMDCPEFC